MNEANIALDIPDREAITTLPVATTDRALAKRLKSAIPASTGFHPVFFYTRRACLDHLIYETPDLVILNFADTRLNNKDLLSAILADRWLNCAGVVVLHQQREDEVLKALSGANVVAALHLREVERKLPRVLDLVRRNRNVLFQRELQGMFTGELAGSFVIDNDLLDLQVHGNLIVNLVANAGYLDDEGRQELKLVLHEMLINAVEHGNLGITFEDKTRLTNEGISMAELIAQRLASDPSLAKRRVHLNYRISPAHTLVTIKDEGKGFDHRARLAKSAEPNETLLLHGRGISMSRSFCSEMKYNEAGNEVSFEFVHREKQTLTVPAFFEEGARVTFRKGQTVFRRGEESNHLYYVASGRYHVLDEKGGLISEIDSAQAFLGEMSFLLNNRRTATVTAAEEGVLYRIAKNRFIAAMQKSPYYAFFLCKLLARRLSETNERVSAQQNRPSVKP